MSKSLFSLPGISITIPWWVWCLALLSIIGFVVWCIRTSPDPGRVTVRNIFKYLLNIWARDAQQLRLPPGTTRSRTEDRPDIPNTPNTPDSPDVPVSPIEPKCSKGEGICKEHMERRMGVPFTRVRPDFLKNPVTGENLELDIYNEDLRLAVEYNGKQHYEYNRHFHRGSNDRFQNQQYRDLIKQQLCRDQGIYLIVVPYSIKPEDIPAFLDEQVEAYQSSSDSSESGP